MILYLDTITYSVQCVLLYYIFMLSLDLLTTYNPKKNILTDNNKTKYMHKIWYYFRFGFKELPFALDLIETMYHQAS